MNFILISYRTLTIRYFSFQRRSIVILIRIYKVSKKEKKISRLAVNILTVTVYKFQAFDVRISSETLHRGRWWLLLPLPSANCSDDSPDSSDCLDLSRYSPVSDHSLALMVSNVRISHVPPLLNMHIHRSIPTVPLFPLFLPLSFSSVGRQYRRAFFFSPVSRRWFSLGKPWGEGGGEGTN